MVLLQQLFQIVARRGPRRLVVGDVTADESLVYLAVEIISSVISKNVKLPSSFRRTFSEKKAME